MILSLQINQSLVRKAPIPSELLAMEIVAPAFSPLFIVNNQSSPQLPKPYISPEEVFRLLATDQCLDLIVQCTNQNAALQRKIYLAQPIRGLQRPWQLVNRTEILAYLGILIYMGLHIEPHPSDYWNTQTGRPIHTPVRQTMSLKRWEQIHRYLHIWDISTQICRVQKPHEKAKQLAENLQKRFSTYWNPGTHVAVDECIEGFTGRTADTVNIPTKPTPIGYKIWVLAQEGYVLDFLFHVRGSKPADGPLRNTKKVATNGQFKDTICCLRAYDPDEKRRQGACLD
jgi:Transposase IS4